MFVTGTLECAYAKTDWANEMLVSGKLPAPYGSDWVYIATASGMLALGKTALYVTGKASVHAAERFTACYLCA